MFSQLDSVTGQPTDPRSMNRFAYAEANPWTFSDPSGHATLYCNTETSDTCHPTQARTGHKMASTIGRQVKLQERFRWEDAQRARATARNVDRKVVHYTGWAAIRALRALTQLGSHESPVTEEEKDLLAEVGRFALLHRDDPQITASASGAAPIGFIAKAYQEGVPGMEPFGLMAMGVIGTMGWGDYTGVTGPEGGRGSSPNPNGRRGSPDHQAVMEQAQEDIVGRGLVSKTEVRVKTPDGSKTERYADVGAYDPEDVLFTNPLELHQVGVQTVGGLPVSRERRAFDDMMTSPDLSDSTTFTFWPYKVDGSP
jgi:hypothetical protein